MVRQTVDIFYCDKCGKEGKRYSIIYDDGTLVLDRCETHGKKVENLRNEEGEWVTPSQKSSSFKKATLHDLQEAQERYRRKHGEDD